VGVSFEEEHFDSVFVFGDSKLGCAREWMQMVGRVRDIKSSNIYYHVKTQRGKMETNLDKIREDIKIRYKYASENSIEYKIMNIDGEFTCVDGVYKYICNEGWMFKVHCLNAQEAARTWNDGLSEFKRILKERGFKMKVLESGDDKVADMWEEEMGLAKEEVKEERVTQYEETPLFENEEELEEAEREQKANRATAAMQLRIKKHNAHSFFEPGFQLDYELFNYVINNEVRLKRWYVEQNMPPHIIKYCEKNKITGNPFYKRFYSDVRDKANKLIECLRLGEDEEKKIMDKDKKTTEDEKGKEDEYLFYLSTAQLKKNPERINNLILEIARDLAIRVDMRLLKGKGKVDTQFKEKRTKEQVRVIKEIFKEMDDYRIDCVKKDLGMRVGDGTLRYSILGVRMSELSSKVRPYFRCETIIDIMNNWYNDYQLKLLEPDEILAQNS